MKKPNIKFKSLLDGIKNIKERNEYFDYLSDRRKRQEIAWDCLKLIIGKKVRAIGVCESYWNTTLAVETRFMTSEEVQGRLLQISECEVCARGGIMLSQIRLGNSIDGYDIRRYEGSKSNLKGFCMDDMIEMELEYEQSQYNHPYKSGTTEKLMNIMCNILVNGNFNTKDKTDYLI